MGFNVVEAKRELIWTKVALMGSSGAGKSYSALRVATGMLEELKKLGLQKNGKILFANTESARGRYYANEFKYDIVDITAPHNPEKYVELVEFAVEREYPILILDSTSAEWEGRGGCLELQQLAGGTYQSWAKVTPRHDKFINALADSPIHVIATMRGKDQYEMEKGENGKTTVTKLGVGAVQRNNTEYEFTSSFLIDQKSNMAVAQKDNTHLFENEGEILLTETHGKKLIQWANSGEGYTVPVRSVKTIAEVMTDKKEEAVAMCVKLGGSKNPDLMKVLAKFEPTGNPKKILELEKLNELIVELSAMQSPQ
jgi:hypothetical protein